jgi:TonB family protein
LWELARERIAKSRLLGWNEPGERGRNARAAVLAGVGALFLFAVGAVMIVGGHERPAIVEGLSPVITLVIPEEKKVDPTPKPAEPQETEIASEAKNQDQSKDPNQNGPTETSTIQHPRKSPVTVMDGSVIDKANRDMDGLLGSALDPSPSNMIDVILTGGDGHLLKGAKGGRGASGDGDRLAAVGGYGLGTGIGNGIGMDPRATGDKIRLGVRNGGGAPMRAIVSAPKPTDVDVGGDAGSRSPESILRVIRTHVGGFRYTYEKALKERPDLGGKISLRFTIAPSGDITAIEVVASSTGDADLDDQIKDKAKRMKFDQIEKGNVTVTYAFVLDRQ